MDNEPLEYTAVFVLQTRGLPDPRDQFRVFADGEPQGSPWKEEDLPKLFPKLWARFG